MALETAASELSAGSIVIVCLACVVGSALVGGKGAHAHAQVADGGRPDSPLQRLPC